MLSKTQRKALKRRTRKVSKLSKEEKVKKALVSF